MFNNRKDPLVDSVQKVMKENSLRREAETALNRSLGITSKRALPHEKHAAYDQALAEATAKVLAEGVEQIDEISKGALGKYLKGQEYKFDLKKGKNALTPHKDGAMVDKEFHRKMMKSHDMKSPEHKKAYHKFKKRDKGISTAIDKLTGTAKVNAKEEVEINEISKDLAGRYLKKATHVSRENMRDTIASTGKKADKAAHSIVKRGQGISTAVDKLVGKRVKVPAKDVQKEENLAEVSKKLVGRYINKANRDSDMASFQQGKNYGKELATKKRTKADQADSKAHADKTLRREKGISTAVKKLAGGAKVMAKEETLAEVSKGMLGRYIKKATADLKSRQAAASTNKEKFKNMKLRDMKPLQDKIVASHEKRVAKREKGINAAADKLGGTAKVHAKEDVQRIAEVYLKKKLTEWGERPLANAGVDAKALQPGTKVPSSTTPPPAPPMRPASVVQSLSPETKDKMTPKLTPAQTGEGGLNKYTPPAQTARPASTVTGPKETPQNPSVNSGTGPTLAPQKASAGQPAQSGTEDAEKNKLPPMTGSLADRVKTAAKKASVTTTSARTPSTSAKKAAAAPKQPAKKTAGMKNQGPLSGHPEWARKAFSPDSGG